MLILPIGAGGSLVQSLAEIPCRGKVRDARLPLKAATDSQKGCLGQEQSLRDIALSQEF